MTLMRSTELCYRAVKVIEIVVEIKDYHKQYSAPIHSLNDYIHSLLIATHSFTSTYFGGATIVLKLPLTSAALTNG